MKQASLLPKPRRLSAALAWLGLAALPALVHAQATDITQVPLVTANAGAVKPNVMFVIDDSGSMAWDFLPDHIVSPAYCRSSTAFNAACCTNDAGSGRGSNACYGSAGTSTFRAQALYAAAQFNGIAYNPATLYSPPVDWQGNKLPTQNAANTTNWTSVRNDYYLVQETASTNLASNFPDLEWCTNTTYSDCLRNGDYRLPGTVNSKSYTTRRPDTRANGSGQVVYWSPSGAVIATQKWGPHYYQINPIEYCTNSKLVNCQRGPSATHTFPAPIRWCNTSANATALNPAAGSCQAQRVPGFQEVRYPTKFFDLTTASPAPAPIQAIVPASVSFTINAFSCSVSYTQIAAGSTNLFTSATATVNNANSLAAGIVTRINASTATHKYSASASGSTVTITADPTLGNVTSTLAFTRSPSSCSSVNPASPQFAGFIPAIYPGTLSRVDIVPSRDSYPKGSNRTDCAASTCTYAEEMTNFANWWTYYKTRMQSMKSSASLAFQSMDASYRVGYNTINNYNLLNLAPFEGTHRQTWYSRLTATLANQGTPLRSSLTTMGKFYAGKSNGAALRSGGTAVVDPMQYACQANYTVLSTDGYWTDGGTTTRLDNTTAIGDTDGTLPSPKLDRLSTPNTLADIAAYFYSTDLRTGTTGSTACTSASGTSADVCGNGKADSGYETQRMITYTLGLGASGYMQFDPQYSSQSAGDFFDVKSGTAASPTTGICPWQTAGTACTWPAPTNSALTTIDDLWHAAVNGDGRYFSAQNPAELVGGLNAAIDDIKARSGAGAAASTSNPNVTTTDRNIYLSSFQSPSWTGDLKAQKVKLADGTVESGVIWSAQAQLEANTARNIYMRNASATSGLTEFNWANLASAGLNSFFQTTHITATGRALTQFCSGPTYCLTSAQQSLAQGEALVAFLRGDRSNEGELEDTDRYFRKRVKVLGDIVNSESIYVADTKLSYTDGGFAAHKAAISTRTPMIYVGANDGMLHAFRASDGAELWAYVPTEVIPNMYRLADKLYGGKHQSFVDSTPVVAEVFDEAASKWRTILVSGLGMGGRAYFALDVTDPTAPIGLWEFKTNSLGFTLGTPEIAKTKAGKWVVMLPSGYNNTSPGDGKGRLFVLDAIKGTEIITGGLATSEGTTAAPSGLGHIRAWVDDVFKDNTAQRVYGTDNQGNVWRFDINDVIAPNGTEAHKLISVKDGVGGAQPITSKPTMGLVDGKAMVFVGTGRLLGLSDLTTTQVQSVYAIKDVLDANTLGNPRVAASNFVKQTITQSKTCPTGLNICTAGTPTRTNESPVGVDLSTKNGWYVDLPESKERVNVDPLLIQGTLIVNSNVPDSSDPCGVGGRSWANYFDYRSGSTIANTQKVTSVYLGDSWATRPTVIRLPNGSLVSITRLANDSNVVRQIPFNATAGQTRFISWRELPTE
jgi:type IV pilus assembly protein PilY1